MDNDEKTVEDLQHDLGVGIEETIADRDGEVTADEIAADMAVAVSWDAPREVALEFFRRELGYVPSDYARANNIPATDFLEDV